MNTEKHYKPQAGWFTTLLAFVLFIFMRLLTFSLRYKHINRQYSISAEYKSQPVIYAVLHGHQLLLYGFPYHLPMVQMCSLSHDGELLTRVFRLMGFTVVRGSSSRRGREAAFEMTDLIYHGCWGALAVDGPRGPYGVVKRGIVDIARDSQALVIPLVAAAKYSYSLKSWDRFILPLPFSAAVTIEGKPIEVPLELLEDEAEAIRNKLERQLHELDEEARAFWRKS